MRKILPVLVLAMTVAPSCVFAQERAVDGALGAVAGAVVAGPVGLVAGVVVGATAGPSIASSWGLRHHHHYHHHPAVHDQQD
ncbi:MAG TPA: hypothetical protein VKV77_07515 [Methylovirgula sp.]|nr:hypothetical protein [Methylovirgula sp.]